MAPLAPHARRAALTWALGVLSVALLGGAVRVLPWLLDPSVPARVAIPFARTLVEAACEVALLVGFPVGFAMAAQTFVERGEARVLALLGERTASTVARLAAHAAPFALALALVGFFGGRDASEPGRVATDLVAQARASCDGSRARVIPFLDAAWLCRSDAPPRLYARGPGGLPVTGAGLRLAGDLRSLEIDDARLRVGGARARAGVLVVRGLAPWAQAMSLSPLARALVLALASMAAALASVAVVLERLARSRFGALLVGAAGPLAVLGLGRALDRASAAPLAYTLLPIAAALATALSALLASRLLRRARSVRV